MLSPRIDLINPKPKHNPKAEQAFLAGLSPKDAVKVAGSQDKLQRILSGKETLEDVYNQGKDELYKWKRVGDIITTRQHLPVLQEMTTDVHKLRNRLDELYVRCRKHKPLFDQQVIRLAEQTGGKALLAPLKTPNRAFEKVVTSLGGAISELTDVLRATLIFEEVAQVTAAHDQLSKQLPVLRERNLYREGLSLSDGYRDAKIDFDFDGIPVELQFNTQKMLNAKEKAHGLYEEKRLLLAEKRTGGQLSMDQKRRLRELDRQMRTIYREAE